MVGDLVELGCQVGECEALKPTGVRGEQGGRQGQHLHAEHREHRQNGRERPAPETGQVVHRRHAADGICGHAGHLLAFVSVSKTQK